MSNAANRRPALAEEAKLIKRHVSEGRVLDVGCDLGDFFEGFPDPNWQRYGVELSPSAAAYAAATYSAQVFTGTLEQAAYPSEFFDLVTLIDVVYYLDDPRSDFQEICRVLKPGGMLAVELTGQVYQLWRSRGLLCWLFEQRWTRLHTDSAYLMWPTPAGLRGFLQEAGLQIIGWQVIPSPEQANRLQRLLSRSYYLASSLVTSAFASTLTLTPKYLCLARKVAPPVDVIG